MSEPALQPCPFCAPGKCTTCFVGDHHYGEVRYRIETYCGIVTRFFSSKEAVAEFWNTRCDRAERAAWNAGNTEGYRDGRDDSYPGGGFRKGITFDEWRAKRAEEPKC